MRFLSLLLLLSLSACASLVPAKEPAQLAATAGVPIIINDEMVDAGNFTVDYPDGWRVVKLSLAGAPIELVFVAPDETMRITVREASCEIPESTPEFGTYWPYECRSANGVNLLIQGYAERENSAIFDLIFAGVVDSIRFP